MTIGELKEVAKRDPRLEKLLQAVILESLKAFTSEMEYRLVKLRGVEPKKPDLTTFHKAKKALLVECHKRGIRHLPMMTPSLVARVS